MGGKHTVRALAAVAVAMGVAFGQFGYAKDIKTAVEANNQFGWSLFSKVVTDEAKAGKDTNLLLSALSANVALSMAQAGAQGDTQSEMLKALGYSVSSDEVNQAVMLLAVFLGKTRLIDNMEL